jgi:hypothetical protein
VLESEIIKTSGWSLIVYLLDNLSFMTLRNFSKIAKPFAFVWKIPLNEGGNSMDVANFSSIPKEIN